MQTLTLKPNHKAVRDYYAALSQTQQLSLLHEGAVAPHFANLLRVCARQFGWSLEEQYHLPRKGQRPLQADGVLLDSYKLRHGVWEAKDTHDDLAKEVKKKFAIGYPQDNILFQAPERAMLYQNGRLVADEDISQPENLVEILRLFCEYRPPAYEQWETAVAEFKEQVPQLAQSLLELIEQERKVNGRFRDALTAFKELMREAINPNISDQAVEEMLIQHLLTERIFRTVFNNPDFARRNVIAREIEKVIEALTSRHFSRASFLGRLDRFYGAIETTAATIEEYAEKQDFLNTVYEQFFQGFSVKVADTHGIVYTPQPIVEFMVRSVDDILRREFGKADGLASDGVAILDPFVGTGNFILRVMRQMPKSKLPHKYAHELFCNEVMLLPYYIASMNMEHEYVELTGRYEPFTGISLVDTFELAEGRQMPLFAPENTQRVQRQKNAPIFVIIGNPPYNAHQVDENDNSKNRQYPVIDGRVAETYAKDSKQTNKVSLSDVYVKAIRWASDRIGDEGIIAFVANNSFVDALAFDGVRKHLRQDFNRVYVLDLKGNIRKDSMRDGIPLGEQHTVFGLSAMVGIAIMLFVKAKHLDDHKVFLHGVPFRSTRVEKFELLEKAGSAINVEWQEIEPNEKQIWLTEGMQADFENFLPIGTREAKAGEADAIFSTYGRGVATSRDAWVYNFDRELVSGNIQKMIAAYNLDVLKWASGIQNTQIHDFVDTDNTKISWSESLKFNVKRGDQIEFSNQNIRESTYRPFVKSYLYFDQYINERRYQMPSMFPTSDVENRLICLTDRGSEKPFMVMMTDKITDLHIVGAGCSAQCFPFYTYEPISQSRGVPTANLAVSSPPISSYTRRENITDWALAQFRARYQPQDVSFRAVPGEESPTGQHGEIPHSEDSVRNDMKAESPISQSPISQSPITKWHIFHYIYALLHHPTYRATYAANLRRELPRIPFVQPEHFWPLVQAGERLAHIHVHYESQPEYPLTHLENPDEPLDWRVEKMRLSKEKTTLRYNDFLTLTGIPPQTFDYKLGNRSALDWVIDQYQVSTDKRSGITNDPNRADDETYILRLIKQVITVSLETVNIVQNLPPLEILETSAP